jgi:hypothetical protein
MSRYDMGFVAVLCVGSVTANAVDACRPCERGEFLGVEAGLMGNWSRWFRTDAAKAGVTFGRGIRYVYVKR